ncbi:MAG: methyl-accepting chemotaxis protein [Methylocystis sp.]|uniref:methyl-accepting chemotaxis protein n=1 Tax=Methylocystis sp. TaxID=1911079 RepID=UPI003DA33BF4
MTIGTKIIGGFTVVLLLFLLVATGAYYARDFERQQYNRFLDARETLAGGTGELRIAVSSQIQHYRGMFLFPQQRQYYIRELEHDSQRFAAAMAKIHDAVSRQEYTELNEIASMQAELERHLQAAIALVQRGNTAEAIAMSEREMLPRARLLTDKTEQFRSDQLALLSDRREQLGDTADRVAFAIALTSAAGFVLCLLLSIFLTRSINRQLRATIAQLTSSSAEILAMTTQVAGAAAETATAVSQTTTTVEEVKQTVLISSQKAKLVSDIAQETAQVSVSGQQAVEALIDGINRIRSQTVSTADSIARLGEQSQAIGEIIATVNDLAEQSNLLAVNAAIEAAKAGEQGKGFAVVALEVRTLAEQSRQATAQVRTILNDIQKATGLAVMATDLNGKAVEDGARQSGTAGITIQTLSENIINAAQAALQIAASSQQQLVGMDQVALAMENIKQASAQNMAGTKQTEVAAQNLHEMGLRLKQLVER